MAVLTLKGKTTNDSVAIKNPTGDLTYFTAGETSATLGTGVTIGSGVTGTLGSGVTIGSGFTFPAGHVVQVQSITFTDPASTTGAAVPNFANITGANQGAFEKEITVTSGNHVLILYDLAINTDSDATRFYIRLIRNHSETDYVLNKKGDAAGDRERVAFVGGVTHRVHMAQVAGSFLDVGDSNVATLSGTMTYKLNWCANDNGYVVRLNHSGSEGNNVNTARSASTLTLMEIQV